MKGIGRGGAIAAMLALAASGPSVGGSPMVIEPAVTVDEIPRSALGNGSRGHRNNKPVTDRAHAKRRRKLALHSKRRNRR